MIVPIPPIDADHAIPSISAVPNFEVPGLHPTDERMPRPSGSIMAAVAVLEIHIERNAVTPMIPRRILRESAARFPLVSNHNVSRWSSFHFSPAKGRKN